jgi:tRNA threonylcarbamoyladenosine biosynthesis protein TsaB
VTHLIAIETSGDSCSVAGFIDGKLIASERTHEARSHSRLLAPLVKDMLARHMGGRLDCIAVSAGPGSFTGLRIGVSTAKGLAFSRDARIVAVPTLESVASAAMRADAQLESCMVVAPSRKGELYYGCFKRGSGQPVSRMCDDQAATLLEFEAIRIQSPALSIVQAAPGIIESSSIVVKPDATEVGYCALPRAEREEFEDTSAFEPYYLKAFHAKKPKQSALDRLPF